MEMVWDVEKALKVNANVYHVYIACMLARFREKGMLNFGVIKDAAEATGRCMAQYLSAQGVGFDSVKDALLFLNDLMGFTDEVKAVPRGDMLEVRLDKEACRMCPWNVGGLGLPGPVCPNIGFIKGYLEGLGLLKLKETNNIEKGEMPLKQENGQCIITYQILEKKAEIAKKQEAAPVTK
jgi:hypothetical protein